MSPSDDTLAEMRAKAVAGAEAVYRLSAPAVFDAVLARALRVRATEILSLAAGFALRSGLRRTHAAEELAASAEAACELISFAERSGWVLGEHARRVAAAYRRIAECAREAGTDEGTRGPAESGLNQRQRQILRCLSLRGRVQVADLKALLGEAASEKTLQRDLWQLVSAGFIRRQGGNRWTTYIRIGHQMSARELSSHQN